jgi:hypothetical protein
MCKQTIVMGDRKRIGSLFCFLTNRAPNRMVIRTQIQTRVDIPLSKSANNNKQVGAPTVPSAVI